MRKLWLADLSGGNLLSHPLQAAVVAEVLRHAKQQSSGLGGGSISSASAAFIASGLFAQHGFAMFRAPAAYRRDASHPVR